MFEHHTEATEDIDLRERGESPPPARPHQAPVVGEVDVNVDLLPSEDDNPDNIGRNEKLNWEVDGDWLVMKDTTVPVRALVIDRLAGHGQIRVLSDDVVKARMAAMRRNAPTMHVRALVWQERAGGVQWDAVDGIEGQRLHM